MANYRIPAGFYRGVQTASSSYYGAVEGLMFIDGYYK
jgi:hypothetical protein